MEREEFREFITGFLKKYRWAMIVVLSGLIMITLPEGKEVKDINSNQVQMEQITLQQELEILLSKLEGAGKVSVLLTHASGPETYFQTDETINKSMDSSDTRTQTVLISDSSRNEAGLVRRIDPPIYLGAVILCQGADSARVRLAVVDAVATTTGLTSDKISVGKMK